MPPTPAKKRIAFLYQADPTDPRVQSGRPHSILKYLTDAGHEVLIFRPPIWLIVAAQAPFWLLRCFRLWSGDTARTPLVGVIFAILARYASSIFRVDIIFSTSTIPFRKLQNLTDVMRVACVDTLLPGFDTYYKNRQSRMADINAEALCLGNIDILIVPTRWAATQVAELPIKKPVKIIIAPFGANLIENIDERIYRQKLEERLRNPVLNLLLISSDWNRKNGDRVLDIANFICKLGFECEVHVIGEAFPREILDRGGRSAKVYTYGYIEKATNEGHKQWLEIVGRCHFHVLLSKGEAFGMSICEAASLGIPSLVSNKGGLSSIVSDGISGWVLNEVTEATINSAALSLLQVKSNTVEYLTMSARARQDYVESLNWRAFMKSTFESPDIKSATKARSRYKCW